MATIMLPGEIDWVLDLLGFDWPNVDEDKMRQAAEAWSSFADAARQAQQHGDSAAQAVHGANSGDAIQAFDNKWKKFSGDGFLDEAAEAAEALGFALQVVATIIMVMKLAVIAQLIALAWEWIAAQAAAVETLGASEGAAAAATVVTRQTVREILNKAKTEIIQAFKDALAQKVKRSAREMAVDLLKELAIDSGKKIAGNLATQGIKSHFGAQDGFDWKGLGTAAVKPVVDKKQEIVDGGAGVVQMGEGIDKVAHGDFSGGGKDIWDGNQKAAKAARSIYDIRHKDKEPAASGDSSSSEGGGDGGSSEGGSSSSSSSSEGGSGSSSEGGSSGSSEGGSGNSSSSSSGSDGSNSSSATAASGGARSRTTVQDANTDNSGEDEAARVRNAFG